MNWTWIFHFTKDKNTNHTNNTHSHTRRKNCHKSREDDGYGVPNKHFAIQTVLNIIHTSEPAGKNAQIALQAQENLAGCTPVDLLGLGAPQLVLRRLSVPPRKRMLAASAEQGRNREDPRNKWFWQLVGMSPKPPSRTWEPWAMAPWSLPGASSWWRLPLGKTPRRQVLRELSLVASKSVSESGSRCSELKSQ